jgi:hypothetical protein
MNQLLRDYQSSLAEVFGFINVSDFVQQTCGFRSLKRQQFNLMIIDTSKYSSNLFLCEVTHVNVAINQQAIKSTPENAVEISLDITKPVQHPSS